MADLLAELERTISMTIAGIEHLTFLRDEEVEYDTETISLFHWTMARIEQVGQEATSMIALGPLGDIRQQMEKAIDDLAVAAEEFVAVAPPGQAGI